MSVIGDILSGRLRAEMKSRVDEVLKAGNVWNQTAQELIGAINKLVDAIQKGDFNPSNPKSVAQAAKKLAKETKRLTKAFEDHNKTLAQVLAKYG